MYQFVVIGCHTHSHTQLQSEFVRHYTAETPLVVQFFICPESSNEAQYNIITNRKTYKVLFCRVVCSLY